MKPISKLTEFKIAWIALICLSFSLFLGKAGDNLLRGIDSNIHSAVSMDVTSTGFLPKLPITDPNLNTRDLGPPFNDHPFFFFWINGWIMRALGPSAFSARILTASFSTGCIILTFCLGQSLYSTFFGFLSAIILLFTRDIVLTGGGVSLDPALLFFILLSFFYWQKEKWILTAISAGVGLWFKTPVVLLVFPTAIVVSLLQKKSLQIFQKIILSTLLALFIGSFIWIATGWIGGWGLVQDYWVRQVWGTAVGGRNQGHRPNLFLPLAMIRRGFIPGLPLLLLGLSWISVKKLWKNPAVCVSLSAIGVLLIALAPMSFSLDYYYNPVFPFLAFLSSFSLIPLLRNKEKKFFLIFSALALPLLAVLLCSPIRLGPEAFVALKRFMPLIQSYGTCQDHVLIVAGGEPVGSALDYRLALKFYTGRTVTTESCSTASSALVSRTPEWIVISCEHWNSCLSPSEKALFPRRFQVGSQYLASSILPNTSVTDLTPLERELKPVIDGRPPAYPKDIYHP